MSKNFDICIRGDGVVGRTLALLLAQQQLRVALVSTSQTLPAPAKGATADAATATASATATSIDTEKVAASSDVRAYALNQASRQLLEQLRAWPTLDESTPAASSGTTPVLEMQVWGDRGGAVAFAAHAVQQPTLAWIVEVPSLLRQLGQALRFQPQIEILPGGSQPKATLTVHCEGQAATARQARFGAQWHFAPYPQKAIAAHLQLPHPHQGIARQWFMPGGEVLALLPMGGLTGSQLALVWSVTQEKAEDLEGMDNEQFCAALQDSCQQAIAAALADKETSAVFDPLAGVELCSARASWPLTLSTAQNWVGPGWALAGDAAHTVHPLAGQGLNLGLADAACLAGVLAAREYWRPLGDEKLLRRYERARKADVAAIGLVTDGLQSIFGPASGPWQLARNWGMNGFENSGIIKRWAMQKAAGL